MERRDGQLGRLPGLENVDLSSFAGKNVEVSITYASDPGVSTDHSLYRGFGLEGVPGRATRAQLMGDAMRYFRVH